MAVIGSDMGPSQGGPNGCPDHGCLNGTLAMGWGSGTTLFPYLIDPLSALVARAKADHTSINWSLRDWDNTTAVTIAQSADVAIVGIASDSGEEYITVDGNVGDRNNLTAWNNGDELVKAVAAVNNNTIVVVHSVGPMTVEEWIEHPNITAVVWAGLPGQESGNSLVDVLYGAVNPSGRLPYTIAKQDADYPTSIDYLSTDTPKEPQVNYDEKLNIDYRHFLANGIEPRFGFGFGLSYSSFAYANLAVEAYTPDGGNRKRDARHVKRRQPSLADGNALEARTNGGGHGGGHGGHGEPPRVGAHNTPELHKPRYSVSIQVSNTGGVDGHDTPQLYLVFPEGSGEPPRVFRDFERVFVKCDATVTVKYTLSKYDLSIWDVVKQEWVIPQGAFGAVVAKNAFDEGVRCDFTPEC
jgi:beta-glucosidase